MWSGEQLAGSGWERVRSCLPHSPFLPTKMRYHVFVLPLVEDCGCGAQKLVIRLSPAHCSDERQIRTFCSVEDTRSHDITHLLTTKVRAMIMKTVEGWSRWHRSSISLCTLEMENHDGQHSSEVRYWCDTVLEPYPTESQGHPDVLLCSEVCQLQ